MATKKTTTKAKAKKAVVPKAPPKVYAQTETVFAVNGKTAKYHDGDFMYSNTYDSLEDLIKFADDNDDVQAGSTSNPDEADYVYEISITRHGVLKKQSVVVEPLRYEWEDDGSF